MSENLWADFDKKISELSTKADELDGLRVRLEQLPERLKLIKDKTETLLLSAKGTMSESLKKEIAKKVQALDAIFNKLQSTKNVSEPLLQKLEGELKNLEDFADSSSVKMDESAQKQSVDVIPPPVERKLLDLGPPTNSVVVKDSDPPPPPSGHKFNYLAEKAAAEVAKAKAVEAEEQKAVEVANSGVPNNIQGNTRSAREQNTRKSFIQGEGEGNQVNNGHIPVNVQKKLTKERKAKEAAKIAAKNKAGEQGWRGVGGFLSSKKYSHKRRNRKLKSQKRAKLMKRKSKAHKKASTRRR